MNKLLIILSTFLLISCTSNSQNELELEIKRLNLPIKVLFSSQKKDSTYAYICLPKRVVYENKTAIQNKVIRYDLNKHQTGINHRDYRLYKYDDSLVYPDKFIIKPFEKGSIDFYYGYLLKLSNSKLKTFIGNKEPVQIYRKLRIYNIEITDDLKHWVNSKINDSIKGQIHFELHNNNKNIYFKSLDIELFD